MTSVVEPLLQATQFLPGISGWGSTILFAMLAKGTVLLMLALLLALTMRRASAASRHLIWTLALGAMLALPAFALTIPAWKVPIFSSPASIDASDRMTTQEVALTASNDRRMNTKQPVQVAPLAFATPAGSAGLGWILFLWAMGSTLLAARMLVGEVRVRRLTGRSQLFQTSPASSILEDARRRLGISRAVELRTSSEVAIPFTRGILHPVILLPRSAGQWPHKHLEFVLTHELAHVKRHDCLAQLIAQAACALFWFHPLIWLAAARMRKERERACDDIVLSLGHPAADYAEFLLALGRTLRTLNPIWSTTVAMAQPSQLEVRMKALLNSKLNHRPLTASRVLFSAVLTIALLVPAAAIRGTAPSDTGNISGTLHDPSGAVIPDAVVTLISSKTQTRIASRTGEDGTFTFPAIPAGRYRLEFAKPGFARTLTGKFGLGPSTDLQQNFTLDLGWVSEEVVVRGHRPAEVPAATSHPPHRIRVGGLVQAAKLVKVTKPAYPAGAEKQGTEGTVILRAVIGTDGQILSLEPYNGADPALIKAAMDAVRQWRYQPTLLNGVPVEVATTITVVFRLD